MIANGRRAATLILPLFLLSCTLPSSEPIAAHLEPGLRAQPGVIQPDLILYKSTPGRSLFLHVFEPDRRIFADKRPAIVFFHGGGWTEGSADRFYDQARHLAERGMVAISADYRIGDTDGTEPRTALADAISAMRFIRTNAEILKIDSARIAAGGGSAGGQLSAALATTDGFDDPDDDPSVSQRPSALVLFSPVIDNGPGGFGHSRVQAYWEQFSPLHNVRAGHPPTIIMLGTADQLIPVETAKAYCQKVRAAGSECRLHLYPGQPHTLVNRRRSERHYQETLRAMDTFLSSLGYLAAGDG